MSGLPSDTVARVRPQACRPGPASAGRGPSQGWPARDVPGRPPRRHGGASRCPSSPNHFRPAVALRGTCEGPTSPGPPSD